MKRFALWGLVVLITTAAFASDTRRYVVATKRPARVATLASLTRELRDPAERRVTTFELVDAFAADLTESEVAALRQSPEVRWIEPVVSRRLMATVSRPGEQMIPYGVSQIQAPAVWSARRSGTVNVVVIDCGVDSRHPELAGAWAGGYDVLQPGGQPRDAIGHGTHVAGIIAAADNHFGVVGVAPNVRLWGVKAVDDTGNGTMEDVIKAADWVVAKKKELGGNWVINMSLGGEEPSEIEREAFRRAAAAGIILVAATGNGSNDTAVKPVSYPAGYESVIAVGAIDEQQVLAKFSNQGPEVDFVAPGVKVVSTILTGTAHLSYVRAGNKVYNSKPLVGSKAAGIIAPYVYCGLGGAGDFTAAVQGKIALIQRGGEAFATKTRRAIQAGAVGVAIYNHNDTNIVWTLYDPEDPTTKNETWPIAVALSKADGEELAAAKTGVMTIAYEADDYDDKNGTSMSTPHVAGAVALLWSLAPNATPANILSALTVTARDLGPAGKDNQYGHGAIDVHAAAKMLAPEAFNPTGRKRRSGRS